MSLERIRGVHVRDNLIIIDYKQNDIIDLDLFKIVLLRGIFGVILLVGGGEVLFVLLLLLFVLLSLLFLAFLFNCCFIKHLNIL